MPIPSNINCIIIEDEPAAARILETYIAKIDFLQLQQKFSSVEKALPAIAHKKPDLIFLDINLPGISGIQFVQSSGSGTGIIFTTAYTEYAVESFELDVIDYLLKPISFERFTKAVNRYLKFHGENIAQLQPAGKMPAKPFIIVRADRQNIKILLEEIVYIEAQRNHLLIYSEKETLRIYQSISDMEEKLPEGLFVRVHRSFIVSADKIKGYTAGYLVAGTQKIPIGRMYARLAETIFGFRK
jgi:DNA-binding LytR/AlgR family response regulator